MLFSFSSFPRSPTLSLPHLDLVFFSFKNGYQIFPEPSRSFQNPSPLLALPPSSSVSSASR